MSTTMEQNRTVIRRFFQAWNNRQPEAFDALIAPNVAGPTSAGRGGAGRSEDDCRQWRSCWSV
jgi:hypothetical protein